MSEIASGILSKGFRVPTITEKRAEFDKKNNNAVVSKRNPVTFVSGIRPSPLFSIYGNYSCAQDQLHSRKVRVKAIVSVMHALVILITHMQRRNVPFGLENFIFGSSEY